MFNIRLHCCLLDKTCRDCGAPWRIYFGVHHSWYGVLGLRPGDGLGNSILSFHKDK